MTAVWRPCVAVPLSPKKRQSHETEYAFTPLLISKLAHAAFITGYKNGSWPSKDLMTTHTHTHTFMRLGPPGALPEEQGPDLERSGSSQETCGSGTWLATGKT